MFEKIEKDSMFLSKHNLIDYSLLVFQIDRKMMLNEKKIDREHVQYDKNSKSFRLSMIKKGLDLESSSEAEDDYNTFPASVMTPQGTTTINFDDAPTDDKTTFSNKLRSNIFSQLEKEGQSNQAMSEGFSHVESIDGRYRYKFGVIDFITNYSTKKLFENRGKSFLHRVDKK
jgi:hypothetical protein